MDVSTDLGGAGTLTHIPYMDVSTDLGGAGTLTHILYTYLDIVGGGRPGLGRGGDPHTHTRYCSQVWDT